MNKISLHTQNNIQTTSISNTFLDFYMPKAGGEYVKVYLYLLRVIQSGQGLDVTEMADLFDYTENDIKRALNYWKKSGLLNLEYNEKKELKSITLLDTPIPTAIKAETAASAEVTEVPSPPKKLTADRIAALKNQEEIAQLLFIASQYLGKTLTTTEINTLLYFYDTLHFSSELIEYLVEYCVSKGSKSSRYMEKVAQEWYKEGITSVEDAKKGASLYNKNYYTILKAFGIMGRGPAKPETDYMSHWLQDLNFTMDIIIEACNRTISQTGQPSFSYADKILEKWHSGQVKHLSDIQKLDLEHQQKKKETEPKKGSGGNNKFNNFDQRDYDFDSLEKKLLNS